MIKEGAHVVITGASRGLGAACAEVFHQAGHRVSLLARNREELDALAARLGDRVVSYAGDISQRSDVEKASVHFEKYHGPVDVLINNAGLGRHVSLLEHSPEDIHQQVSVNVTGLMQITHVIAHGMVARREGAILNIASDLARKPLANMAVYTATKHAVAGFSTSLTRELRPFGIKVMLINPGIINTHFGGKTPNAKAQPWQMPAPDVARFLLTLLHQPDAMLVDEVTLHPMGQEF